MNTYKIRIVMEIEYKKDNYNTVEVAQVEQKKSITCEAAFVRDEATKLLKQTVANFSESCASGLKPIIADEPKIEQEEKVTELAV